MTIKKGRPAKDPIVLATDAEWSAPGELWDTAEPTLRPLDGLIATGFMPDQRIAVRHVNYLEHHTGRRLRNLDLIEVTNWPEPHPNTDAVLNGGGNLAGSMVEMAPDIANTAGPGVMYYCNGGDSIKKDVLSGGYAWTNDHTDAGAIVYELAANRYNAAAVATEGGAAKIVHKAIASGWQTHGVSLTDARAIVADDDLGIAEPTPESVFWLAGISGTTPRVSRVSFGADGTSAISEVTYSAGVGSTRLDVIAVGGGRGVAANAAGTQNIYTWQDGAAALTAVSLGGTDTPRFVVWDPENLQFIMGFSNGKMWRSPTGLSASWTEVTANMPTGTKDYAFNGACSRGSLCVVPGTLNSVSCLFVTGDAGETWDTLPDPLRRYNANAYMGPASGPAPVAEKVRRVGNRLVCLGYNASNKTYAAYSERTGRP